MDSTAIIAPISTLSEEDADRLRKSSRTIARFAGDEEALHLTLRRDTGEQTETVVPGHALQVIARALYEISRGNRVSLIPLRTELTTHQAAAVLQVSRPHLIKLLDTGQIPARRVGSHRRILLDDLLAYALREKRDARTRALDEMAAEAQRLGLYE